MTARTHKTNVEIIFVDWLDALRRGDTERTAARLTPDAIHQVSSPIGSAAIAKMILEHVVWRREVLVEALELVGAGDKVVMSVRAPKVGVPIDGPNGDPLG